MSESTTPASPGREITFKGFNSQMKNWFSERPLTGSNLLSLCCKYVTDESVRIFSENPSEKLSPAQKQEAAKKLYLLASRNILNAVRWQNSLDPVERQTSKVILSIFTPEQISSASSGITSFGQANLIVDMIQSIIYASNNPSMFNPGKFVAAGIQVAAIQGGCWPFFRRRRQPSTKETVKTMDETAQSIIDETLQEISPETV